jgi:mercuric ion transport protein
LLRRLNRAISRRSYDQLSALKPVFGLALALWRRMHHAAMTINQDTRTANMQSKQRLMAAGGLVGALAASSCCILPLVLFSLGVSGAWIGNFTRLAPYQPYFLAVTTGCLGYGYWLVYRSTKLACADGDACARPLPNRLVKTGLILASLLAVAALGFDFLAPLLLNS